MVPKIRFKEEEKVGQRAGREPAGGFRRELNRGPFIPPSPNFGQSGACLF